MDPKKIQVLGERAQNLKGLKETAGWHELRVIYEARKRDALDRLAREIMLEDHEINVRELDYVRGFLNGMKYLLDSADQAEATFERHLRRHTKPGSDAA